MTGSPTVKLRRLSAELIRLRKKAGLTVEEVTTRLGWSKGRLTKWETNQWTRPDLVLIRALLDLYGVTDNAVREAILDLARQSREKGWWAKYTDVFRGDLPGFEADATQIRTYEALYVPGLLQTSGYAAAVFRAGQVLDEVSVKCRVEVRMVRQDVLKREKPPEFYALIDEAALRKMVGGPEVMAEQLRHLIEVAAEPHITIQILPDAIGAHAAMPGPFTILDFGTALDPSVVYLETATDSLHLEKPEELQAYNRIFTQAVAFSQTPEESVRYLATLVDQLKM
ncbi:transcriptional regulator with XRE-family HTH domain [Streptosporangium becharense]|uniref:helix-turn-helix domain-containing protein n=1 Tax=Streptosporangium becharense TaxID=1816182 RepID=UPI0016141888|nr:helix-turn-helix transcriptional regulator [Streptosporangium becharense]MBB2909345.1 transcriptional regulator with XRE-family HTH domain [Streptosporangium becharense]